MRGVKNVKNKSAEAKFASEKYDPRLSGKNGKAGLHSGKMRSLQGDPQPTEMQTRSIWTS